MNRITLLSFAIISFCLSQGFALAGKTTLTDSAVKNFGSTLAYIAVCEGEQLVPTGTLGDMIWVCEKNFTEETWAKTASQYQQSLHEKKHYSIAKDNWVPFRINDKNCRGLMKAIPTIKDGIIRFNQ